MSMSGGGGEGDVLPSPPSPAPVPPLHVLYESHPAAVVLKPGGVISHSTTYASSTELPLLQRARNHFHRKVNLAHRLDRGASGAVLISVDTEEAWSTSELISKMKLGQKTYVAWCRGDGEYVRKLTDGEVEEYRGVDGTVRDVSRNEKGWFLVDRAIRNENGNEKEARTWFKYLCGGSESCLILCRPQTGRWHQIRKHLNGLSVPILGDGVHGNSKVNRRWRERGLPENRIGLHLMRLELPKTANLAAIDVVAPIPDDLRGLVTEHVGRDAFTKLSAAVGVPLIE